MKRSDKIIETLNTGIFPARVCFCVGFTYKEIIAHLKKAKAEEGWIKAIEGDESHIGSGQFHAMKRTYKTATYFYVIIIRTFDFSDWDMIMLAHELLHICQFLLPDMLDRDREYESEAYLHSHLMTQALKYLRGKP